jgi:hypothetical protein
LQQGAYAWPRACLGAWEQLELGGAVQVQGRAVQVRSEGLCVDCLTWAWTYANAAMLSSVLPGNYMHMCYVRRAYVSSKMSFFQRVGNAHV